MIKPGWKRERCPQCHMPGRIGERVIEAVRKTDAGFNYTPVRFELEPIHITLHADICDNCGVMYAFKATEIPKETP